MTTDAAVAIHERAIFVGLGEVRVTKDTSAVLTCVGLGSCIAVSAYDRVSGVGGMAHMVLPNSGNDTQMASPRYVDWGIPFLFREMKRHGFNKSSTVVKLVGGAQMFVISGLNGQLNLGERNITEGKEALAKEGFAISKADVGGNYGRTLQLFIDSGRVMVKKAGDVSVEL